uniref:Predicted protein n=1 Tax=Hordeum vulgare subsp. vulgare TaxID=112509 RepID=F2CWY4_HORVV|nr:predicted protein [Hordeum vulgare subsp. vulgare]
MQACCARSHQSSSSTIESTRNRSICKLASTIIHPAVRLLACLLVEKGARCEAGVEGTCPLLIGSPAN